MAKHKTNPNRIPVTKADVSKAYQDGCVLTFDLMLFTLMTDMEVSDEWMDIFHDRYMAHLRALNAGYITQDDLRQTTKEESGWEFVLD